MTSYLFYLYFQITELTKSPLRVLLLGSTWESPSLFVFDLKRKKDHDPCEVLYFEADKPDEQYRFGNCHQLALEFPPFVLCSQE